jgi:hypothetical protein
MALPFGLKAGVQAKTMVTFEQDGKRENVEFSAVCLANAVVYKMNGKPIKTAEVPEQVKEQLIGTMLAGVSAGQVEMAEKPEVPTEVVDEAAEVAKELVEKITVPENVQTMSTPPAPNPMYQPSVLENNSIEDEFGFNNMTAPKIDYEEMLAEAEARSVDNANLRVLVDTLYRRFRIYLPYINQPPQRSDISPTTGSVMNAITFGQAVQGFKTAQRTGASWNPQVIRSQINSALGSSQDAEPLPPTPEERKQSVQPFAGQEVVMPNLHGEPEEEPYRVNRNYDSPHKSAVRSERGNERDGLDPDEVYAEPPINAQTAIIRPFVVNKQSQAKLEEISQQRSLGTPQNISFDDLV